MSLWIEVYVGRRDNRIKVAECHAYNVSGLTDTSDYEFESIEYGNSSLNIPPSEIKGEVKDHNRNSTVWSLIKKIAEGSQDAT